jgi:LuxR family transcriptional regulator, maltose regulon positive regulatory protein
MTTTPSTADRRAGRRRVIERPRLTQMLDETNARIILLTAPAGYGKTTLAQQWLAGRPSAWYRGTPASADVAALALGLAVAAAEIVPGADERLRERLRATNQPEEETRILAELLAEDLTDWPTGAWLAIDDYQFAMEAEASERFVDHLTELTSLRLFVTSRNRPTWATARRILYGEVFELDREALAMSDDEAQKVLAHSGEHALALVERAQGWPAVIGLAALADSVALPKAELPTQLYDYFAEEVYLRAEPAVRWGLCQLAIAPTVTREMAQHLLGEETGALILDHGARLGVFVGERSRPYNLHPLLRTFLEAKLREHGPRAATNAVEAVTGFLARRRQWDDAFAVIRRFGPSSALIELVEAALDEMLETGRLPTLDQWLAFAQTEGAEAPVLHLAQAEIAFRRGEHVQARSLAVHAATTYGAQPSAARALIRAGQSAFLSAREDLALTLHRRAQEVASDDEQMLEALYGQLSAALDLELDDVDRIREELDQFEPDSPTSMLRLVTGRVIVATRRGGLLEALDPVPSTHALLTMVKDPLVRSSFLHTVSYGLGLAGRYAEALDLADQALDEASRYRLAFVSRHAYISKAIAELGLRHFGSAQSFLNRAGQIAREVGDAHVECSARAVMLRLYVVRGSEIDSSLRVAPNMPSGATRSMLGELLASLALVEVSSGNVDGALGLASKAEKVTVSTETRVLASWVRVIAEQVCDSPNVRNLASSEFRRTSALGCRDLFVCAYRTCPTLLEVLVDDVPIRPELLEIIARARDHALARRAGLEVDVPPDRAALTKRELEVHGLIQQGLSNREIAEQLFITEATAKLHVRHILAKLGVRSRTEAALRGPS